MTQAKDDERKILEKIANRITRPDQGGTVESPVNGFRRTDSCATMLSRSATTESTLDDDLSDVDELESLYRDRCAEAGEGPHPKHKTYPV